MTRPLADDGDLLAGFGLKGFYEFTKYYQNDEFYLIFSTEIQAVQLKNLHYYQSYVQFIDPIRLINDVDFYESVICSIENSFS